MKKVLNIFIVILSFALLVGCDLSEVDFGDDNVTSSNYLVLSINPSIEVIVDEEDVVEYVASLNEDGDVLLIDLDLEGLPLEAAVDALLEAAVELGFIDPDSEETFIDLVGTSDEEDEFLDRVQDQVQDRLIENGIRGLARRQEMRPEFVNEAEELGVTVGKLRMINQALAINDELTLEEALEMPMNELVAIVRGNSMKDVAFQLRDEFLDARDEIRNEYQSVFYEVLEQITAIEAELETETDEEAIAELNLDLEALQQELQELRQEMLAEIEEVRQNIHEQRQEAIEDIRNQNQARREENQKRAEEHRNNMENNREQRQEAIEEWVNERRENVPNPNRGR